MERKNLMGILLLFFCALNFTSCSEDEPQDKVEIVKMYVSGSTGVHQPWGAPTPVECMLVKEEKEESYHPLDFGSIAGFEYEKGYEYQLSVTKTTLAYPLEDASNIKYQLREVLSKKKAQETSSHLKVQLKGTKTML